MLRWFGFAVIALLLTSCISDVPYPTIPGTPTATVTLKTEQTEFSVNVFEADSNCDMTMVARSIFTAIDPQPVWRMPAGRAYFRVSAKFGNTFLDLEDVSFVLEEGQEYVIESQILGTSASWRGQKVNYEYNYLNTSGEFPKPVETDHFAVCEREQS